MLHLRGQLLNLLPEAVGLLQERGLEVLFDGLRLNLPLFGILLLLLHPLDFLSELRVFGLEVFGSVLATSERELQIPHLLGQGLNLLGLLLCAGVEAKPLFLYLLVQGSRDLCLFLHQLLDLPLVHQIFSPCS